MQTKRHSIIESCLNVASGMVIAFIISQLAHLYEQDIQKYIWSGFVWKISAGSNIIMTIIFTIVSFGDTAPTAEFVLEETDTSFLDGMEIN